MVLLICHDRMTEEQKGNRGNGKKSHTIEREELEYEEQ